MNGERSKASILNLWKLLQDIHDHPELYSTDNRWLSVLGTQASLAAFSDPGLQIRACVINTFRRSASRAIPGGFEVLNRLRMEARDRLVAFNAPAKKQKPRTQRDYQQQLKGRDSTIDKMRRDFLQMQAVLHKMHYIAQQLATDDHIVDRNKWWLKEMREVQALMQSVGRD